MIISTPNNMSWMEITKWKKLSADTSSTDPQSFYSDPKLDTA
jgi:hypothetical protein